MVDAARPPGLIAREMRSFRPSLCEARTVPRLPEVSPRRPYTMNDLHRVRHDPPESRRKFLFGPCVRATQPCLICPARYRQPGKETRKP